MTWRSRFHRHEAGKLQEARIDLPAEPRVGEGHRMQGIAAEPIDAASLGELIDLGGAAAGVDRAAHQRHAGRDVRVVVRLHDRHRREQRRRRLADGECMDARPEVSEHQPQIVDVIVEIERSERERHEARVRPVRDVDVAVRQELLDRSAQQRRVMAGHRRDNQELRLILGGREVGSDEAQKIAERPAPDNVLQHRISDTVDVDLVEAESRLAVAAGHPLEQLRRRRDVLADARVRQEIPRITEHEVGRVRHGTRRSERRMSHFVHLIRITLEHCDLSAFRRRSGVGG